MEKQLLMPVIDRSEFDCSETIPYGLFSLTQFGVFASCNHA